MATSTSNTPENKTDKAKAFSGYIKDIWLELPDYEFRHGLEDEDVENDSHWVGRKEVSNKLLSYLSDGVSGAYLITGYRGMGKTSFVNKILHRYKRHAQSEKSQRKSIKEITISFGQKDIKELDVLRQMIKGMMDKILVSDTIKFLHQHVFSFSRLPFWAGLVFVFLILSDGSFPELIPHNKKTDTAGSYENHNKLHKENENEEKSFINNGKSAERYSLELDWKPDENIWVKLRSPHGFEIAGALLIISIMVAFVLLSWFIFLFRSAFSSTRYFDRLEDLYDRCRSQITKEDGGTVTSEKLPFGLVDRLVRKFPMANPKEMENEIIEILDDYNDQTKGIKFKFKYVAFSLFVISFYLLVRFSIKEIGLNEYIMRTYSDYIPFLSIINLLLCLVISIHVLIFLRKDCIRMYKKKKTDHKSDQKPHDKFIPPSADQKYIVFIRLTILTLYTIISYFSYKQISWEILANTFEYVQSNMHWYKFISEHKHLYIFLVTISTAVSLLYYINKNLENIYVRLFYARKFIFIFDEIDKIEPNSTDNGHISEHLEKFTSNNSTHTFGVTDQRKAVINILANLKYLITTAKAKFVFIAGREMFDASLADIADRQSSISSIFNEVIYVDSFLKDRSEPSDKAEDERTMGLTMLVEDYLEKIMLPKDWRKNLHKDKELKTKKNDSFVKLYYKFLEDKSRSEKIGQDNEHARRMVVFSLQSLIVYLTYRSNGSPKKVIRLIEEMIKVKYDRDPKKDGFYVEDKHIKLTMVRDESRNKTIKYYININYNTHYRLGIINYIYRSFLSGRGNEFKRYSDKILVSTPYLLDHIIKFHPFAFSLRNLELVPEVISDSRSPELRYFIEELVIHLNKNHIRNTETQLFDYKFTHRTFHELSYLCKMFENESAAFNFTLNENNHVKQIIRTKIIELRTTHKEYIHGDSKLNYVKSISYLNELLGNAYYYDEEYDDAIIAYHDALQTLEQHLIGDFSYEIMVSYISLKLKLGLSYEKTKDYNNALSIYAETFSQTKLFLTKDTYKKGHRFVNTIAWKEDLMELINQPVLAGLYLQEKMDSISTSRINSAVDSVRNLYVHINDSGETKHRHIVDANLYSGIGTMLYYKNTPSENNVDDFDSNEYKFITNYKEDIHLELREFRMSISTYKYLKQNLSALLKYDEDIHDNITIVELLQKAENYIAPIIGSRSPHKEALRNINPVAKRDKKQLRNIAAAIFKLANCLYCNLNANSHNKKGDGFQKLNLFEFSHNYLNRNDNIVAHYKLNNNYILDNNLPTNAKNIEWSFYLFTNEYIQSIKTPSNSNYHNNSKTLFQFIMCMYFFSGEIYMRIGRNMECNFIFQTIIQSFRLLVDSYTIGVYENLLEKYFLNRILHTSSWNSSSTDRFQAKKYEYAFHGENLNDKSADQPKERGADTKENIRLSKHNILSTSGSSELRETLILYSELKLKTIPIGVSRSSSENQIAELITQYNTIPTQTIRYYELRLQVELNKREVLRLFHEENFFDLTEMIQKKYIKFNPAICQRAYCLIANSIFSLYQIITIYNGYGLSYWMSYSSLGKYHELLGNWLILYTHCKEINGEIQSVLEELLGADIVRTLDHISEYNKALEHYSRSKQLHSEGTPYKSMTVNMYYLEDDFTDSLYLYSIAVERQKINSGIIRHDIEKLKKVVDNYKEPELDAGFYDYSYYVNTSEKI